MYFRNKYIDHERSRIYMKQRRTKALENIWINLNKH